MVKVEIREATDGDLTAVLSLYAQPGVDDGKVLSTEQTQRILARIRSYPEYKIFVAEAGDEIVGTFALLVMDNLAHMGAPSAVVEDVAVQPDWQGKGIGKQMMQFAIRRCKEMGCYKLSLSSNLKREVAHRFYESLGFIRHGYSYSVKLSEGEAKSS
jgi:GNAT superfamily N-acetyltransferase